MAPESTELEFMWSRTQYLQTSFSNTSFKSRIILETLSGLLKTHQGLWLSVRGNGLFLQVPCLPGMFLSCLKTINTSKEGR